MTHGIERYWQEYEALQDQLIAAHGNQSRMRDIFAAITKLAEDVDRDLESSARSEAQLVLWAATFHRLAAELALDLERTSEAVASYRKALRYHSNLEIRVGLIRALYKEGISIAGPIPADTAFLHMAKGRYDLALAAYHDQGMIPLKLYAPDQLVNMTLGLPFIRTSPGHGTAYDIAGKGKADARPMIEAILLAARYSS